MADEKHIHSEDIVRLLKNKDGSGKIGLVLRSGDSISDSEESFDSSDEDVKVKNGEILVCWYPSGREEVVNESKVELIDRSLQPGDVVRHATEPNRKGYVRDIKINVDICILGTDRIIKNVDCKKFISPLQPLCEYACVMLGPWVGYVQKEYRKVVLWLKNGSRCLVKEDVLHLFTDASDKRDEDCPFYNSGFYPGQSLVASAQAFNGAKWLTKIKPLLGDQTKIKSVVEEANVVKVDVNWHVCGTLPPSCKKEDYEKPPDSVVTEENIHKLKAFQQHFHQVQIGDKCFYVVKPEDIEDEEHEYEATSATHHKQETSKQCNENDSGADKTVSLNSGSQKEPLNRAFQNETTAENEESKKDTSSQNSATSLVDVNVSVTSVASDSAHIEEKNLPPTIQDTESDDGDVESDGADQPKIKTSKQDVSSKTSNRRRRKRVRHKRKQQLNELKVKPGDRVCVEVINTKTTADVMWQDGTVQTNMDTLDLIPVYHIDDHQFFPGYIVNDRRGFINNTGPVIFEKYGVVRRSSQVDRTCAVRWFSLSGEDLGIEDDVSVYDLGENVDMVYNPGDLVVSVNCMGCDNIPVGPAGQVVCVDQDGYVIVNWAGERDHEPRKHLPHELYKVESEAEEGSQSESEESSDETWETASEDGLDERENENEENLLITNVSSTAEPNEDPASPTVNNVDIEALNHTNNIDNNIEEPDGTEVEAFLVLSEVPDSHHYYSDHFVNTFTPDKPRKFTSVVRKEMMLLKSSLPSGILIRGFENAMGLFSVMIMGPKDTPYEDGIFLFDIKLPSDYPASPPSVFFISMVTDVLNPNLYVDGTVCTSLLGTWSGKDNETWTEKSNLLQVLLSIQAIILCKEPYFNEAGYEKQRGTVEGIENSRVYNEMAIINILSSMTATVKYNHPVFNKEIKKHFQMYGQRAIERYKSWLSYSCSSDDGSSTHQPNDNATEPQQAEQFKTPEFPLFPVSKGFCKCLGRNIDLFDKALKEGKLTANEEGS